LTIYDIFFALASIVSFYYNNKLLLNKKRYFLRYAKKVVCLPFAALVFGILYGLTTPVVRVNVEIILALFFLAGSVFQISISKYLHIKLNLTPIKRNNNLIFILHQLMFLSATLSFPLLKYISIENRILTNSMPIEASVITIVVLLVSAFLEEIFIRYLFLSILICYFIKYSSKYLFPVIVSSIFWVLLHTPSLGSATDVLILFYLGIIWGILALKYGIWFSIIHHSTYNLFVVFVLYE
jgi:membrane protease YdiL (CAAX protease family)